MGRKTAKKWIQEVVSHMKKGAFTKAALKHHETPEEYAAWVAENTIANVTNLQKTIAINPAELSDGEFLAPYADEMGINSEVIAQTHHHSM